MFHDYYLCAPDEATLRAALYDEEGNQLIDGDIDLIGTISEPTGETDEEGNPLFEAVAGYHANLRRREPLPEGELSGLLVTPETPSCVWFGS